MAGSWYGMGIGRIYVAETETISCCLWRHVRLLLLMLLLLLVICVS